MKISDKFVVSSVAGENVILPIDSDCIDYNSVFILNETAMFIVSCLPCEKQELVDRIVEDYNISSSEATKKVDEFLTEVNKYGIIE